MGKHSTYIAFDIGAGSGRVIVGTVAKDKMGIREINRFVNEPVRAKGVLYWDILYLWNQIIKSLKIYTKEGFPSPSGIAVDTWGVDFGFIGNDGALLGNPVHYRDNRTEGILSEISKRIEVKTLYELTGLQPSRIATLSQMLSLVYSNSQTLKMARYFLMMPDLFRYFLSGHISCDETIAGTSQMFDIDKKNWCDKIFVTFNLPREIMPPIVKPGTVVSNLLPEVAKETGIGEVPVIAPAGHDTASAVTAVPGEGKDWAFLSCGSWSVIGMLTDRLITSREALGLGFVTEVGVGRLFFAKNMMGLWLLEELRKLWQSQGDEWLYERILKEADRAQPFNIYVDVNSEIFFSPDNPEEMVLSFLRKTHQPVSINRGDIIRGIIEGLAFSYRESIEQLQELLNRCVSVLHIVGGGVHNNLLCQLTADATEIEVIAGPIEAAAVGNIGIQAYAFGQVSGAEEIRSLVRKSFNLVRYKPCRTKKWENEYKHYREITARIRE